MNYKSVLEEQIREIQKLSDTNMHSSYSVSSKAEVAVQLSEQINKTVDTIVRLSLR